MASERVWTVIDLLKWSTNYLTEKSVSEPRLSCELMLADVLGIKRLDLYLQFDRPLDAGELAEFKQRLLRRAKHEPLQYIAGYTDFRELRLKVDSRALIPRPETELLVGEVLDWAGARDDVKSALDLGTGTGAIALSLAVEGGFSEITATDVSPDALALARENLAATEVATPVDFRIGDLFEPVRGMIFDVVVSNPPYVGEGERELVEDQVVRWEPRNALFAGRDGLSVIERIIQQAPVHLKEGGLLALEIGSAQAAAVADLIRESGDFGEPRVSRDLAGHERMILVERLHTREIGSAAGSELSQIQEQSRGSDLGEGKGHRAAAGPDVRVQGIEERERSSGRGPRDGHADQ